MRGLALSKIDTTLPDWLPPYLLAATLLRRVAQPDEASQPFSTTSMENKDARSAAKRLLSELIEHQPNLFGSEQIPHGGSGEAAAQFCEKFIETYAAYLLTRPQ